MRLTAAPSLLALTLALLPLPGALAAQAGGSTASAPRPSGCRGVTSENSSFTVERADGSLVTFPDYAVIETVQPGSPAEAAGFRPHDVVVAQNGRDLIGSPPTQPALAGDTVQFVVRRGDVEVPLTVVMGFWDPPQESPGVTRVCRRLEAPTGRD